MLPPVGKILPGPVAGEPVFADRSGIRLRRIRRWGKVAFIAGMAWAAAIALLIMNPGPAPVLDGLSGMEAEARSVPPQGAASSDAGLLIAVKGTSGPQPAPDEAAMP